MWTVLLHVFIGKLYGKLMAMFELEIRFHQEYNQLRSECEHMYAGPLREQSGPGTNIDNYSNNQISKCGVINQAQL